MKRVLLVVLSVLLFSLLFFMFKSEKGAKIDTLRKGQSYIEGLRLIHRQNGNKDWVLTARRADITEKGDKAFLSGVEMKIEDRGITVYADNGLYNMIDRNLTIDGKVVAKGDNYTITSEQVKFDSSTGLLKADGGVTIESRKFRVKGTGMDADNTGQTVRIRRDVKAVFYN